MAGKNLGSLVFDIQADTAGLRKDMQKGERTIKRSTDRMKKNADRVKTAFKGMAIAGAALGAGAAVIGRIVNQQRELIDNQAKMAAAFGLTTQQLAGYRLGAELSGVSVGQLDSATTRFIKSIGDAGNGLSTPIRALEKLGLTFDDLNGKTTDEQLKLVAERFQGLHGTVEKNTVAMDLFGRSGAKLVKMFEGGAAGLQGFQQEAEALGIAVSELDAKKVEDMNDAFTRSQAAVSGMTTQLTIALAPVLQQMAEDFTAAAKESGGFKEEIDDIKNAAIFAAEALRSLEQLREDIASGNEWIKEDLSSFDNSYRDDVLNAEEVSAEELNEALERREILLTTMLGLSKQEVAEREKELAILNKEITARQASKAALSNSPDTWKAIRGKDASATEKANGEKAAAKAAAKAEETAAALAAKAMAEAAKETETALKSFKDALESARDSVNNANPKLTAENVEYRDLSRLTAEARTAAFSGDDAGALRLAEEGVKAAMLLKESGKESGLVISGALKKLEAIAARTTAPDKNVKAEKEVAKGELTIEIRGNTYQFTGNDDEMKNFVVKAVEDAFTFEASAVGG